MCVLPTHLNLLSEVIHDIPFATSLFYVIKSWFLCVSRDHQTTLARCYRSVNHHFTYLPNSWSSFEPYDFKSSSYYKTKNFISQSIPLGTSYRSIRHFHVSRKHCEKDKSVVEKAVEVMKDKLKPQQDEQKGVMVEEVKKVDIPKVRLVEKDIKVDGEKDLAKPKPSVLQTLMHHAKYYRDGFVLFFKELRIAVSYLWKSIVKGESLTRREIRQVSTLL